MKIKIYRSSTVEINLDGFKILTDPWLTDGEYYGSWSHYPPFSISRNLKNLNDIKSIYISHIHPDHCSIETLMKLKKTIPVYIHKFHTPFLKKKIELAGFSNINELSHGEKFFLDEKKKISLEIYAADDCNPELCYKFTGCVDKRIKNQSQQIDTLSVISYQGKNLVNLNDCPYELAKIPLKKIKKKYNNISILLTGYGGAGPYPQCFDNLNEKEKIIEAKKKEKKFLNQAINYIKILKPSYYLPYAGTYTLTGKLSAKQNLRGVPSIDDAYEYIDNCIEEKKLSTKSIKINLEEEFDLNNPENIRAYKKISKVEYERYIKNKLSKKKLDYENDDIPNEDELFEYAKKAFDRYLKKRKEMNSKIDSQMIFDLNLNKVVVIDNIKNKIYLKDKNYCTRDKYIKLKIDSRLFARILKGPKYAHWNNAEIGSHISYYRSPNIFDRNLHLSLCYFHI